MPSVSIIMATYNRANFIGETLNSVKCQTFNDFECLIIDDGGTDATSEAIRLAVGDDPRFVFRKRPSDYAKGLPGCRNYGLDTAQGKYIIFFDDDDIVHPLNLELCVSALSARQLDFCRYDRTTFQGDFDYVFDCSPEYQYFEMGTQDLEKIVKNDLPINSCAVMWRRECFKNQRFEEHLMYAEEWELYTRLISNGLKGISIKKTLFYGRKHPNSNTAEFFSNNPVRTKSYADAILLVAMNLKAKKILTYNIFRYLIAISFPLKRYNLFQRLMKAAGPSFPGSIRWYFFYFTLPLQFMGYRLKKRIKNIQS